MRSLLGKAFCIFAGVLIAYGFLRFCIDFVNWWQTPRLADWSDRSRVFFLFAWIVLSALASIFCFVVKEEIEDDF